MTRLALVALLALAGCVSPPPHYPGEVVEVRSVVGGQPTWGRGAVVGPQEVITVGHCVGESGEAIVDLREAETIAILPGDREALVVLHVPSADWPDEAIYRWDDGGHAPREIVRSRWRRSWWHEARPVPGDSGSPVVDSQGELVGLVSARDAINGNPIIARPTN